NGEAADKFARKANSFATRGRLKLKPRERGAVQGKGKSPKIATTKDGGIQNIDRFVIKTFHDCPGQVQVGIDDLGDCASCRITTHQPGEAVLEIDNELRANERRNRSQINMPKVRAQGKAFDPFWTVNRSVGPFIGNLRLQIGVSSHDDPNESSIRSQSLRIAKKFGERSEEFGACRSKVGECRRMKPFAVSTTQGERTNPVRVKRLPAH